MSDQFFLDTEMTWVVFVITMIEIFMFAIQCFYWLQRTDDKKRLWYLLLLVFIIHYNVISGFFPDPDFKLLSVVVQNIWAYAAGIVMGVYYVMYWYLAFDLKDLKFMAVYGSLLFILLPFIVLFLTIYGFTGDLEMARKALVVTPFLFGVRMAYLIYKSFRRKFAIASQDQEKKWLREEMIAVYAAAFFMVGLTVFVYFGASQVVEQSITNSGFLVMAIMYVRVQVLKSKTEYQQMLEKEQAFYILQQEVKTQQKALAGSTAKMQKINQVLEKFKTTLREIEKTEARNLNELKTIVQEWNEVGEMQYLEIAYTEFFQLLNKEYPTLIEREKKYLVYLKLGLSNKEISVLMETSMEALKALRYRMKKKMSQGSADNFEEFLQKMDEK